MTHHPDVAHITTAHAALDARIFFKECRSLAGHGFATVIIGPHPVRETVDGVEIWPILKSPHRMWRRISGPISAFRASLASHARIIHFHDPEFIPAAIVLKLLGRKIIYDVHEYYSEILSLRMPAGLLRRFARATVSVLLEKGPAYFFDAVVFPTYALRDAIYAGPRAEVLVNLLPKRALQQDIDPDQKRDHDLVFVGSMSPFRAGPAMEMMVHILAERPNARMLFIGLPEATVSWMLTHCPSDAVRSAMTFHPRVPHLEVSRVITRARIGFDYHPMERRFQVAIPMKVYEYMAVGLPVVSSRFPELERQFRANEEIIFVDGDDQRNYARAVLDLITDSDRRARLAAAGRKRLESGLNWEDSEAPKLITLYNRLLKQGH